MEMLKSHGRLWLLTSSRVWGFILCTLSFKASTVLHGCSFHNFVALPADVFKFSFTDVVIEEIFFAKFQV